MIAWPVLDIMNSLWQIALLRNAWFYLGISVTNFTTALYIWSDKSLPNYPYTGNVGIQEGSKLVKQIKKNFNAILSVIVF